MCSLIAKIDLAVCKSVFMHIKHSSLMDNVSFHLQASPLLVAAQNGHTKCVTLLLQNGGNVLQRDYKDRNSLMLSIENHHECVLTFGICNIYID